MRRRTARKRHKPAASRRGCWECPQPESSQGSWGLETGTEPWKSQNRGSRLPAEDTQPLVQLKPTSHRAPGDPWEPLSEAQDITWGAAQDPNQHPPPPQLRIHWPGARTRYDPDGLGLMQIPGANTRPRPLPCHDFQSHILPSLPSPPAPQPPGLEHGPGNRQIRVVSKRRGSHVARATAVWCSRQDGPSQGLLTP